MKRTVVAIALTSIFGASMVSADEQAVEDAWGSKTLWVESQGRFGHNSVVMVPERACPGDYFAESADVTLSDSAQGTWNVSSYVKKASNMDAFIVRFDTKFVPEGDGPRFPSLSTKLDPTAEVLVGCFETSMISVSTGYYEQVLFHAHDPKVIPALEKAGVTYVEDFRNSDPKEG